MKLRCGRKVIALEGMTFGRLSVLRRSPRKDSDGRMRRWVCRCECGEQAVVRSTLLTQGLTKSCGCLRTEKFRERLTKHGGAHTLAYSSYTSMLARCGNPSAVGYEHYGGRGITVCERWHKFENFLADMGERAHQGLSLDRVDPDGNYEPSNCRWATRSEQAQTTRKAIARRAGAQPQT